MHVEAFVFFQPRLWGFVGGVVVDDQVQLEMLGRFSVDHLKKIQPLLRPALILNATDQAPLEIVQRGEQRDGTMADIVVRLRADMAEPQG